MIRTAHDVIAMKTIPISPPVSAQGGTSLDSVQSCVPDVSSTTRLTTSSVTVPTKKFCQVVAIGLLFATDTRPLTACWTAIPAPTRNAATAGNRENSPAPPVVEATTTPTTATIAASNRTPVTACTPAGPSPSRSTSSPFRVCPPTTATLKIATPTIGTDHACTATNSPPKNPPMHCHHFSRPARSASMIRRKPRRTDAIASTAMVNTTSPEPKLHNAAISGRPLCSLTTPFKRDWTASIAPEENAPASARNWTRGEWTSVLVDI